MACRVGWTLSRSQQRSGSVSWSFSGIGSSFWKILEFGIPGHDLVHELLGFDRLESRGDDEAANVGTDSFCQIPDDAGILPQTVCNHEAISVLLIRFANEPEGPLHLFGEVKPVDQLANVLSHQRL